MSGAFDHGAFDAGAFYVDASTFTLDAIVRVNRSGSFTLNAIVKRNQSGSFTLDSIVRRNQNASFVLDAIVRKDRSGSFTLNAWVPGGTASQFTLDAWVRAYRTFSLDSIVRTSRSGSLTLNAIARKVRTGSFTANAYIRPARTFTLDAWVLVLTTDPNLYRNRHDRLDWHTALTPADKVSLSSTITQFPGASTLQQLLEQMFEAVSGNASGVNRRFGAFALNAYVLLNLWESFDRTTTPDDPGGPWLYYIGPGVDTQLYCNGTHLVVESVSNLVDWPHFQSWIYAPGPGPWGDGINDDFDVYIPFNANNWDHDGTGFYLSLGTDQAVGAYVERQIAGSGGWNVGVYGAGDFDENTYTGDLTPGAQYFIRWQHQPSGSTSRIKFWQGNVGDEPGTWFSERATTGDTAPTDDGFMMILGIEMAVDYIDFR